MEKIDKIYNEENLRLLLNNNSLSRNKNLNTVMNFLNNIDNQLVLNLDDNWGTGKTVFLRQLIYLGNEENSIESIPDISSNVVKEFREKYHTFYFNAWEHDFYDDPLESLIYSLLMKIKSDDEINSIEKETLDYITGLLKKAGILALDKTIKKISSGMIELQDFKQSENKTTTRIVSMEEKKNTITKLVECILESKQKNLLIVIDELDRCKPSYAVKILEVIKHFFVNNETVFLFGSNKEELAKTVEHEYGTKFEGYKYLNRFFDFEFSLPSINSKEYIYSQLNPESRSHYYYLSSVKVCNYFNFHMRDINKYCSLCGTLNKFFDNSIYGIEKNRLIQFLILPYSLGLKIESAEKFKLFINGQGLEDLLNFYSFDPVYFDNLATEKTAFEKLKKIYELFEIAKKRKELNRLASDQSNYNERDLYALEEMFDVLTMMAD